MDDQQFYFDLVKGAIFGQAIGDALGHPIEFQKTHVVEGLEPDNKFTDDTQMFCAIGEAMLEAPPHIDIEKFMEALSQRFIDWRSNPLGGSHRAPGNTCMEAVRKLGTGRHWRQTGKTAQGKGNGSAMRAGIIGARYWKQPAYAFRLGCLISVPTHNNLESILASGMVAFLVAASIAGREWDEAVADGLELCSAFENNVPDYPTNNVPFNNGRDGQSPWKAIMLFANGFIRATDTSPEEFVKGNGNDFTAVPAVAEAIYYNTRHDMFDEMVLECANNSDDSDTITAITGTIAGARWGFDGINEDWGGDLDGQKDWKQSIEMREYLHDLSRRIFEASIEDAPTKETKEVGASVEHTLDIDEFGSDDEAFGDEKVDSITVKDDEEFEVEF